jgi:DNA-directed RNA polymerase subunit RPC12/RpoP
MSIVKNVSLRTTYTQKIEYMASVLDAIVQQCSADHIGQIELAKYVYPVWYSICTECKHEHENKKNVEVCEKCGSKSLAYAFPKSQPEGGAEVKSEASEVKASDGEATSGGHDIIDR